MCESALSALLARISEPDRAAMAAARRQWNGLAKPLGSLGRLEEAVVRIAGWTGQADVRLPRRELFVFCADNGVVARGVAQSGPDVTAAVARALGAGESTVCHMAQPARCAVTAVDVGILDFPGAPGVWNRRIRNGTADIAQGPAMRREECVCALLAGAQVAAEGKARGASILAAGEMGIGNTTTTAAVACALLGGSPEAWVGRGAGLSGEGLRRKRAAVQAALAVNRPDPRDPVDVLSKVGGLDIAALCGFYLGCAAGRVPVLLDGAISAAAALCAVRLCPAARGALLASHVSAEPVGRPLLEALGLEPLLDAGLRLGEGSGAVAALPLLDMALAVYHGGQTFGRLGIDAYTPQ